jgi:isoleucyl-tRNA synthetase
MRGKRVERRFGWDTHGLPAELEAMSQLGIKTKEEIDELGIERFNRACRESATDYAACPRRSPRRGRPRSCRRASST